MLPSSSPSESATLFAVGKRKRGNDGRMYVVMRTRAGVQRWVVSDATASPSPGRVKRTVFVVDNGGTPFIVDLLDGQEVTVSVHKNDASVVPDRTGAVFRALFRPWRTFRCRRVFVGSDPTETKKPSLVDKLFGMDKVWWHGGNSVLLQVGPGSYVYVGETIYGFSTAQGEEIVAYASPMGNNAVPYPFANGTKNTYLMVERTYIPNMLRDHNIDPYEQFYEYDLHSGRKYSSLREAQKRYKAHAAAHALRGLKILHKQL